MLTSTGNDQPQAFHLQLSSLALTSKTGNKVTLFSTNPYPGSYAEFVHLNGLTEPFLTVSIPQDTYVAATTTVGGADFTCVSLDNSSGSLNTSIFAYGITPADQVTTNLSQPITIGASPMGIVLDLQTTPSATFSNCIGGVGTTYSITPTFNLEPLPFGSVNSASTNEEVTNVQGIIASVNPTAGTFAVTIPDGPVLTVASNSSTTFQGVSGAAALATDQPVDIDIVFDAQGTIDARRIQVLDTNTSNVTYVSGAVALIPASQPTVFFEPFQSVGFFTQPGEPGVSYDFSYANAAFTTSGYVSNLSSLPFTPVFNAATMVDGQRLALTTHLTTLQNFLPLTTITLLPQTLNGTIVNVSTVGSGPTAATVYTVTLAPYDLFPDLDVQQGQPTRLTSPQDLMVYVQGGNTGVPSPSVGSPYRFTGLVFNDGGVLRMDCLQILPGVPA